MDFDLSNPTATSLLEHIVQLLVRINKPHAGDISRAVNVLAGLDPQWASREREADSLARLRARWANRLAVLRDTDFDDIRYLLNSYRSELHVSVAETWEVDPLNFSDELRFACVKLSALTFSTQRITALLRIELYDSEKLFQAVFNECWLVKAGADLEVYGKRTPDVTVRLLQLCLDENPVNNAFLRSDNGLAPIALVRYVLIAVLASEASRASKAAIKTK